MAENNTIPWKRLSTEGLVIVVSILLAFAIDAWWEERQEQTAQLERLARVAAEIEVNSVFIERKIDTLVGAIDATSVYLSWMGPDPDPVTREQFSRQWGVMLDIGMFSITRRSTDEYLGAAETTSSQQAGVRQALLEWYTEGDLIVRQHELLRTQHSDVAAYSVSASHVPVLATMDANPVMDRHPKSRFPVDTESALSDPREESLLSLYLIRMEFVVSRLRGFQARQEALIEDIRSTIESN